MPQQGRIFVTGDIHGQPQLNLSTEVFPEGKNLTKKDMVIILGDFGLLWSHLRTKEEEHQLKWLDNKPWTTLFIDGNHENFHLLNNMPEKEMFGDRVGIISHSVFHLRRGICYRINGRKILTLGGAHSHDRQYREWGKSMWKDEEITDKDIRMAISSVESAMFEVDYILTHCAPVEWAKHAMPFDIMHFWQPDHSEEQLSWFKQGSQVTFKRWFFGHYHNDIDDPFMDQWSCLYNKVVELEERE